MRATMGLLLVLVFAHEALAEKPPLDPTLAPREAMVRTQIEARGVRDRRVLDAMRKIPRHLFVPTRYRTAAYEDHPLPIGEDQTISQPYIVAAMTELLHVEADHVVLEVGTGSGYQAAVLSVLAKKVYSIEIVPELARSSRERLRSLRYDNVEVIEGDGYQGLPDRAPFHGIVVTAAPDEIPAPLLRQLAVGGRLVIPVGRGEQELLLVERTKKGYEKTRVFPVRFVPMTGEAERRAREKGD